MNALEKYAAKKRLTTLLMEKTAIAGLFMQGAKLAPRVGQAMKSTGRVLGSMGRTTRTATKAVASKLPSGRTLVPASLGYGAGQEVQRRANVRANPPANPPPRKPTSRLSQPPPQNPTQANKWTQRLKENAQRMGHGARRDFNRQMTMPVTQSTISGQ